MSPPAHDDPRTDEQLVAAANRGDAGAFTALYLRHEPYCMKLAMRFAGEYELAADAVQDTFTYFYKKFPGFTLTAKLTTFLFPVVKHNALAAKKKARRAQGDHDAQMLDGVAGNGAADDPADRDEAGDLHALLARLSEGHREVLLLRYVDGLMLEEIAELLQIPLGTVKTRVHHAIKKLQDDPNVKKYFFG